MNKTTNHIHHLFFTYAPPLYIYILETHHTLQYNYNMSTTKAIRKLAHAHIHTHHLHAIATIHTHKSEKFSFDIINRAKKNHAYFFIYHYSNKLFLFSHTQLVSTNQHTHTLTYTN